MFCCTLGQRHSRTSRRVIFRARSGPRSKLSGILKYLLDTNVVSEPESKQSNLKVIEWIAERDPLTLHTSAVTFGEIDEGIALLSAGYRRYQLEAWRNLLARATGERVIPVGLEIAAAWGVLRARGVERGPHDGPAGRLHRRHGGGARPGLGDAQCEGFRSMGRPDFQPVER
jgi:predicted nucleic acid-binding protein